jgi:hypothetical protein
MSFFSLYSLLYALCPLLFLYPLCSLRYALCVFYFGAHVAPYFLYHGPGSMLIGEANFPPDISMAK